MDTKACRPRDEHGMHCVQHQSRQRTKRRRQCVPDPPEQLDVVNTIPAEMKFNETIRRYSLPKAITRAPSRSYVGRKNSVAVCRLMVATTLVGLMLPRAAGEWDEELRQTHASASFVDEKRE